MQEAFFCWKWKYALHKVTPPWYSLFIYAHICLISYNRKAWYKRQGTRDKNLSLYRSLLHRRICTFIRTFISPIRKIQCGRHNTMLRGCHNFYAALIKRLILFEEIYFNQTLISPRHGSHLESFHFYSNFLEFFYLRSSRSLIQFQPVNSSTELLWLGNHVFIQKIVSACFESHIKYP